MKNTLDQWEWIYAFFRSSLELNGSKATKAANLLTGEARPEPDDKDMLDRIKSIIGPVHDQVCDCLNSQHYHN